MSELKKEYPTISFDAIKDEGDAYYDSLGDDRESDEKVADRARELFAWLKDRPETNIAVVRGFFVLSRVGSTFLPCFLLARCRLRSYTPTPPAFLSREFSNRGSAV